MANNAIPSAILWLLIVAYAVVTVVADGLPNVFVSPLILPLAVVVPVCFALLHGSIRHGFVGMVAPMPLSYWFQACVLFAVMAMDFPATYLGGTSQPITDATGKVWQTGDINEAAAIASLYTMLFVAVASSAALLLRRSRDNAVPRD